MILHNRPRHAGKTTSMIHKLIKNPEVMLIVNHRKRKLDLVKQFSLNKSQAQRLFILADLLNKRHKGQYLKLALIDDIDIFLQQIVGIRVSEATITGGG